MPDDIDILRSGVQRFRSGGIAIGALPLVLGVVLLLTGQQDPGVEMIIISVLVFFLVFWAAHCAEEAVNKLQAGRGDRP